MPQLNIIVTLASINAVSDGRFIAHAETTAVGVDLTFARRVARFWPLQHLSLVRVVLVDLGRQHLLVPGRVRVLQHTVVPAVAARWQQQLGARILYVLIHGVDGAAVIRLELGQVEHGAEAYDGQRDKYQRDQAQLAVAPSPPAERHRRPVKILVILRQHQ